jgi:hypothetical protein
MLPFCCVDLGAQVENNKEGPEELRPLTNKQ